MFLDHTAIMFFLFQAYEPIRKAETC